MNSPDEYCRCGAGARAPSCTNTRRCETCGDLIPPTDAELGTAVSALQDAISDARSDGARAAVNGDVDGAREHRDRAERLRRVCHWLEGVDEL